MTKDSKLFSKYIYEKVLANIKRILPGFGLEKRYIAGNTIYLVYRKDMNADLSPRIKFIIPMDKIIDSRVIDDKIGAVIDNVGYETFSVKEVSIIMDTQVRVLNGYKIRHRKDIKREINILNSLFKKPKVKLNSTTLDVVDIVLRFGELMVLLNTPIGNSFIEFGKLVNDKTFKILDDTKDIKEVKNE